MSEDKLAATRGIHNVEEGRSWDAAEYERRALERQDRERGVVGAAELLKRQQQAAGADGDGRRFLGARAGAINFERGVGKSRQVSLDAVGSGKAGYHCELCVRTFNDSQSYLVHINSPEHLNKTGVTMAVRKSSLLEVVEALRGCIATKYGYHQGAAREDKRSFEQRVADADQAIADKHKRRAEERKRRREAAEAASAAQAAEGAADDDVMLAMGFGSFGGKKAKR